MIFYPAVQASFGSASAIRIGGILGLLWMLPWISLRVDASESKLLSKSLERDSDDLKMSAIEKGAVNSGSSSNLSKVDMDSQHKMNGSKGGKTPWKSLLSNPAIWAIITNNFAFHYTYYVLSSWIPTYFEEAIGEKMAKNKLASMAPYVLMFMAANGGGWAGDWLIARQQGGGIGGMIGSSGGGGGGRRLTSLIFYPFLFKKKEEKEREGRNTRTFNNTHRYIHIYCCHDQLRERSSIALECSVPLWAC